MKNVLYSLALIVVAGSLVLLSQADAQRPPPNPDDVFIDADTDSFDPGLPIGTQFPEIRALYQGQEVNDLDGFIRDKGAVFLAQRSADW